MAIREVAVQGIKDRDVKEAFVDLNTNIRNHPFTSGDFKFLELEFKQAVTDHKIVHGFDFVPTDIIQTFAVGSGTVTWLYTKFDREAIYLSTTGPVKVRFLFGRFK